MSTMLERPHLLGQHQTMSRGLAASDGGPLRILYHHRIAASDGMRVHLSEIVEALRAEGHIVQVVGPGSEAPPSDHDAAGSRLERFADRLREVLPAAAFELLEVIYNLPAYLRLRRAAEAFRPDVIYERYNLFLLAGLHYARRHHLPYMLEINSPLAAERAAFGNLQLTGLAKRFERTLWRSADAALPVTGVLAREVSRQRRSEQGVHVVPNGFNLARRPSAAAIAEARARLDAPADALILGFVGFIRAWHGVGWAIEALPELARQVHLVIVGDGPARTQLEERARALGVAERVHFTGRVPHDQVTAYAQTFDVALQTASVAYASPLKLFEYMGMGLAVIAPDQPNIREVLSDYDNALLFAPKDETSFRCALRELCADSALRLRLGAAAARTVRETPFSWEHNAQRIVALAWALLRAKAEGRRGSASASKPRRIGSVSSELGLATTPEPAASEARNASQRSWSVGC